MCCGHETYHILHHKTGIQPEYGKQQEAHHSAHKWGLSHHSANAHSLSYEAMELKNLEENLYDKEIFWCVSKRNLHGTYGVCAEQVNDGRRGFSNFTFPQKTGKNYASYLFLLPSLP
jgi:hypothetical protein